MDCSLERSDFSVYRACKEITYRIRGVSSFTGFIRDIRVTDKPVPRDEDMTGSWVNDFAHLTRNRL